MTPNKVLASGLKPIVERPSEADLSSAASDELAFLFYTLLDYEDLAEVFGEFLVPAESVH